MPRTTRASTSTHAASDTGHASHRRSPRARRGPRRLALLATLTLLPGLAVGSMTQADAETAGSFTLAPGDSQSFDARQDISSGRASVDFVLPELATGGGVWTALAMRDSGGSSYRARVRVMPDGSMMLGFSRVVGGRETLLTSEPVATTYAPGKVLHVEGAVAGASTVKLKVRAWLDGKQKPAWQERFEDQSPARLTEEGTVRAWAYLSGTATDTLKVGYDDLAVDVDPPLVPVPTVPAPTTPAPTAPAPTTPAPDTTAPSTTITSGPADGSSTTDTSVTIGFTSDDDDAVTQCRLDSGPWISCASPWKAGGLSVGKHVVSVRSVDEARNIESTPATRSFEVKAPAAKPPVTSGKPSAGTTGVPAGTRLTRHDGDIVVTKAGTVIDALDVHGSIIVRAPNVKITRTLVRGGKPSGNTGAITNYGSANLVVEDTDVKIDTPSVWTDGVKGWNFTLRRVHVDGGVDSVKIHGDNVTITDSLLENTDHFASDPNQGGGETHNDNVQVLKGRNLVLDGNTIRGSTNFAVLAAPEQGATQISVVDNWLDGGHCTVKLAGKGGAGISAVVRGNQFGANRAVKSCVMYAEDAVGLTASANVFEAGLSPITIIRGKD